MNSLCIIQLQALASELKTGFTEAMQELSRIQHGEYALEEKVKSCKCSMEEKVTEMKNSLNYFKVGPSFIFLLKKDSWSQSQKWETCLFAQQPNIRIFSLAHLLIIMEKYFIFFLDSYVKIRGHNGSKNFIIDSLIHSFIQQICIKSLLCTIYYVIYFYLIHQIKYISILIFQEELSNAMSMIQAITSKQEEMQQKIEQLQQEKRRESRKVKAK